MPLMLLAAIPGLPDCGVCIAADSLRVAQLPC